MKRMKLLKFEIASVMLLLAFSFVISSITNMKKSTETKCEQEPNTEHTTEQAKEINVVFIGKEKAKITFDEYNLLLRVCMSECGGEYGEPLEGKIAVVETILNRCEIFDKTIEEVVFEPNQYSLADNGLPDDTVREAVDVALRENIYPDDMIYFRTSKYHDFGKPYQQIGNHYFSLKGDD